MLVLAEVAVLAVVLVIEIDVIECDELDSCNVLDSVSQYILMDARSRNVEVRQVRRRLQRRLVQRVGLVVAPTRRREVVGPLDLEPALRVHGPIAQLTRNISKTQTVKQWHV